MLKGLSYGELLILVGGWLFIIGFARTIVCLNPPFSKWGPRLVLFGTIIGVVGVMVTPASLSLPWVLGFGVLTIVALAFCLNWPR